MIQMEPIDYQSQVIAEVGDPNGTLFSLLDPLWQTYAMLSGDPLVIALYVKRALLDMRLAELQREIDIHLDGRRALRSQLFDHVLAMRKATDEELQRREAIALASSASVGGALSATAPTTPPCAGGPDANSDEFRGSPYTPVRRIW